MKNKSKKKANGNSSKQSTNILSGQKPVVFGPALQVVPKPIPRKKSKPSKPHKHLHTLCSITDPFCVHARGAKLPDDSTVPTFPWQFKTVFAVITGAAGQNSGIILANNYLGYNSLSVTPNAAGVINAASFNPWTGASSASANFSSARIVTMGCTFYPTVSMSSAQGYIIFNEIPKFVTGTNYTDGSTNSPNSRIIAVTPGRPISWIARPEGVESRRFYTFDSASIDQEGFSSLHWEVIGGPGSVTVGIMEVIVNLEVIPKNDNTVVSKLATPSAQHNPKVLTAQNAVMNQVSGFVEGAKETVSSVIADAAKSALSGFAEMAFGLL